MRVKILYRLDTKEFYTTDSQLLDCYSWEQVLDLINHIESLSCTVIEVKRVDIE